MSHREAFNAPAPRAARPVYECPAWCDDRESDPGHAPQRPHMALVGVLYGDDGLEVCVGVRQVVAPARDGDHGSYPPRRMPPVVVVDLFPAGGWIGAELAPDAAMVAGRAVLALDPESSLGAALVEAAALLDTVKPGAR